MQLSMSVVIYKSDTDDLKELISSYSNAIRLATEKGFIKNAIFYIVDNCPDNSQKLFIDNLCQKYNINYHYIVSQINGGYGYGHNQAICLAKSCYHIICNPDIKFYPDTLVNALDFFAKNKKTVLLTPAVFGQDGERHYLCKQNPKLFHLFLRRFCSDKLKKSLFNQYLERYEFRDHSYEDVIKNIPFCTGAWMFFRTNILQQLRGFDEQFFMYMEDADLSRRALTIGETVYAPSVKVIHRWERGSYKNKFLRNTAIKSALKYWLKWDGLF
jgi:GT2 family glycosyltransferase